MHRIADFRRVFAQVVVARAGCPDDVALLDAFAKVPRHDFLGPGPWAVRQDGVSTGSDDPALVYQDVGLGLAPGTPNGLPSLHAELLHAASVRPGERVMHVGAGTGYYTAILAELVGDHGRVLGFEIEEALAVRATHNLAGWPWASVQARSGVARLEGTVDLVYVNAGVQQLPRSWIDVLSPGGRVLFPLVGADGHGAVCQIRREASASYAASFVCLAQFVPCIGTQDERAALDLTQAFRAGRWSAVQSLRLSPEPPDHTAWFVGDGWWLSTERDSQSHRAE